MNFDSLLRGYLDGSLSPGELERFQSLIDASPEYRAELLQTLDVRSALHDDALRLSAPPYLLERTRLVVAAAFATSVVDGVDPNGTPGRRSWLSPLRLFAGSLVTACLVAGLALTPTTTWEPMAGGHKVDGEASGAILSSMQPSRGVGTRRNAGIAVVDAGITDLRSRASAPVSEEPLVTMAANENAGGEDSEALNPPVPVAPLRSLREDLIALETSASASPRDLTSPATQSGLPELRSGDAPVSSIRLASEQAAASGTERYRRLAIGVLVGSGQVAELKSLTALLQNSYYFSFGVNPHDRIGLEMGASAFERHERVPATQSSGAFAKPTQGGPESGGLVKDDGNTRDGHGSPSLVYRQYQQQITYGGVFYDRRLRVNSAWDLCGRVTFGGADNSIVGGLRAYAAYTPTANRNITLTLGVGGSGLYNLTDRDNNIGGNYGIYYGIETGF